MSSFSSCPPPPRVLLFCVLLLFPISFPERVQFTFSLSLSLSVSLSLRETQKTAPPSRDRGERRRYEFVGCLRSLSLSLCVSESGDKESEFKTCFFSIPNERKTLQNASFASFAFLHSTNNTEDFCTQKEKKRERDDDATRREEASPRIHRPNAFFFFFFFFFHPRRGRIFALLFFFFGEDDERASYSAVEEERRGCFCGGGRGVSFRCSHRVFV